MPTQMAASSGSNSYYRPHISFRKANFAEGEFRLLEIQRADSVSDRVVCRTITASHGKDVEYIALSALYGDVNETEAVFIDGQRVALPANVASAIRHVRAVFLPAVVAARPNGSKSQTSSNKSPRKTEGGPPRWLVHALRHVRSIFPSDGAPKDRPLRLWFDALCVNHRDAREAKEQLSHMGQAYRNAKVVVGWLGPADQDSEMGIDTIKFVNDVMPPNWGDDEDRQLHPENYAPRHEWFKHIQHFWAPSGPTSTSDSETQTAGGMEVPNNQNLLAVHAFLARDYFMREWVLSEMALASHPTFLAGTKILSWKHMLRLARLFMEMEDTVSDVFPAELRSKTPQMPLSILYGFLSSFERMKKKERLEELERSRQSDVTGTDSTNTIL